MQRFVLAVLLLATLWSALPIGDVLPTGDPEVDPIMINTPPPRN